MTASTAVLDRDAAQPARSALDGPDRVPLRETIRAAVVRARPRPVAQRTLELLAEAALEPTVDGPGYRIVDRHGAPRERAGAPDAPPEPMTVADLVAELQALHPGLFLPPEPVPEPEPPPIDARESPLSAGAAEMRAATARFVDAQSVRARSLAERSSLRGRALAQSAAGALAGVRARFEPRPAAVEGDTAADPGGWAPGRGRFRETLTERLRDRFGVSSDEPGRVHRRWFAGAAVAALVAVVGAGLVTALRAPVSTTSSGSAPPQPAPSQTARAPAVPDTVTPPPEGDGRGDPEAESSPTPPNAVTGPVQVIDTATLRLGGKVVRLFGVEWVRGGQGEELARYIGGRTVVCQPAPGSETMNCLVEGRDLSEVVLYNGGGRASPEASPELVAAEDHARSERLGVWKR